jgi:hypothetical protein
MRKLLSASALASTAILAAATLSSVSAASLNNSLSVGHVTVTRPGSVGVNGIGANNQVFTPNGHGPKLKPPVKVWVCGPIVNWDGSKHCHWVTH